MTKSQLRHTLPAVHSCLPAQLAAEPLPAGARRIFAYSPLPDECDCWPLLEALEASSKTIFLPIVRGDDMDFYPLSRPLIPGAFGIMEPPRTGQPAMPVVGDIMLVPGMAFDTQGNRLGRGAGYYDRYLSAHPGATLVGICPPGRLIKGLPTEPHDIRMHHLIAPTGQPGVFSLRKCPFSPCMLDRDMLK